MQIKRVLSYVLALALSFSLAVPALAAETFTDVSPTDWYYSYVSQCVEKGLMEGMGDGTFAPESKMTVAQFITVAVKASYASELANQAGGSNWWDKAYLTALDKGLITANEYANTSNAMNTPITRKEMARIASRVTTAKGEYSEQASSSIIPDYSSIGQDYRADVLNVYGKGILAGIDEKGTFNPDGVLTRAEACTVALKLLDKSLRSPQSSATTTGTTQTGEAQSWVEGQTHSTQAKKGDTVIRADGTKVVLEETTLTITSGYDGSTRTVTILGLNQNVDYITGWGNAAVGKRSPDGSVYVKDVLSNSVFTETEWKNIKASNLNPNGKRVGDYDGEIYNTYWQWDSELFGGGWLWIGPQ